VKAADTHRRITALRRKRSAELLAIEQAYSALRRLPKSATHKYVARSLAGWLCSCDTFRMLASALVAEMATAD
jgi:hypothetical protein